MTVHDIAQRGVSLTDLWTQAVSAALMTDRRLFHAWGPAPARAKARSPNAVVVLEMIRSPTAADRKRCLGSDRATSQPYCRGLPDSLVHSRGEICLWVDITWTSPVAERATRHCRTVHRKSRMWLVMCGRICWECIQSWLVRSWQIEACP